MVVSGCLGKRDGDFYFFEAEKGNQDSVHGGGASVFPFSVESKTEN